MDILSYMRERFLLLDGGMGTLLQERGLGPGERPERWALTHPQEVKAVHRAYFDAGCHVVITDTFGANRLRFEPAELSEIVPAAVACARAAAEESAAPGEKFVALDIGPCGQLLAPMGELEFEEAVALFAETVRLGAAAGADLVFIETMGDLAETRAAVLAAKENCSLPVFVSNSYRPNGRLLTGAPPEVMVPVLEAMGADAIGINCSMGPEESAPLAETYLHLASVPVFFKPNAGLPEFVDGKTLYRTGPEEFGSRTAAVAALGLTGAGGCCGTTPEHLAALARRVRELTPGAPRAKTPRIASARQALTLGEKPVLIGDRINPAGREDLRAALRREDMEPLTDLAVRQEEAGAQALDVHVFVPGTDQAALLAAAAEALQAETDLPLMLDTMDPAAMERALRAYNGKAVVNSCTAREESMGALFPLVKKYGGMAVCLTMEGGSLPETAEERLAAAEKILRAAAEYGLGKADLIFDPLTLAAKSAPEGVKVTLETVRRLKAMGCLTLAAVSNVSFSLPGRKALEAAYMDMAIEAGASVLLADPAVKPGTGTPEAREALLGGRDALDRWIEEHHKEEG